MTRLLFPVVADRRGEGQRMETMILLGIVFAAAFAEGMSGIGMSLICMATLPVFFGFYQIMMLTKMLGIMFESIIIAKKFGKVNWKVLAPVAVISLGTSWIGLALFPYVSELYLKRALGCILTAFSSYSLFSGKQLSFRSNFKCAGAAGACSGFLGGLLSVPGPPLVFYYLGVFGNDKSGYMSTICATFLIQNLFQVGLQVCRGAVGEDILRLFAVTFVVSLLGYGLGQRVFHRLEPLSVRRILYVIMMFMGICNLFCGYVFN